MDLDTEFYQYMVKIKFPEGPGGKCVACGEDWSHLHYQWHCSCVPWFPKPAKYTDKEKAALMKDPLFAVWADQFVAKFGTPIPWLAPECMCKICGCGWSSHAFADCCPHTKKKKSYLPFIAAPHTQKAKGIMALLDAGIYLAIPSIKAIFPVSASKLPEIVYPAFARPCPVRPRHGFVPSRVVSDSLTLAALVSETADVESDAEIVCMSPIEADHNAILTPSTLTIGPGNDGATGGKRAVAVPVGSGMELSDDTLARAGITETPYVELVYTKARMYVTQLRNGIPVPLVKDVVPHKDYKVTKVIEALPEHRENLLAWESIMHAAPKGTAVYAPGFPLACHVGVHARMNDFACLTSGHRPNVGEVLQPVADVPQENPAEARAGAVLLLGPVAREPLELLRLGFAGVHNSVWWLGRCDKLLGASLAALARAALVICAGEARFEIHAKTEGKLSRTEAYRRALRTVITPAKAAELRATHALGKFSGGFGGINWACIAHAAIQVLGNLESGDLRKAVEVANMLLHMEHNGGWCFNKVCEPQEMDKAASFPGQCAAMVAPAIYRALTRRSRRTLTGWQAIASDAIIEKAMARQAKLINAKQKFGKVKSVATLAAFLGALSGEVKAAQVRPIIEAAEAEHIRIQILFEDGQQFEFTFKAALPASLANGKLKSWYSDLAAYAPLDVEQLMKGKLCPK